VLCDQGHLREREEQHHPAGHGADPWLGDPEAHGGLGGASYYISLRDAYQLQRDKFNTLACGKLLITLDDQPPRSEKGRHPTKGELSSSSRTGSRPT
jgi:hypothetical protein